MSDAPLRRDAGVTYGTRRSTGRLTEAHPSERRVRCFDGEREGVEVRRPDGP